MGIRSKIRFLIFKYKWKKNNKHNFTSVNNIFDSSLVKVKNYTYGELNIISFANDNRLYIGNFVSIAQNVSFLLDVEHYVNHISTYPYKVKVLKTEEVEAFGKGDIVIDDDVWIGYGATILSGVHIGQGAVIAAGALVSKDVPPYGIVGGVPAKLIKYRFDSEMRDELLKIDYSKLDKYTIQKNIDELYLELIDKNQLAFLLKK